MAKKQSKKGSGEEAAEKVVTLENGEIFETEEEKSQKVAPETNVKKREISDEEARKAYKALSLSVRNDFDLKTKIKDILALSDKEDGIEALKDVIESGKLVDGLVTNDFIKRAKEDLK